MKYLNIKSSQYGTETIDEIDERDYDSTKEYKRELRELLANYRMSGHEVYISNRATNEWKNR